MHCVDDPALYRLSTRLLNELQNKCGSALTHAFDGELDQGGLYALIAREAARRAESGEAEKLLPSINGLATSLSRPYETVRRHVHRLAERNIVCLTDRGVSLRSTPEHAEIMHQVRSAFVAHMQFFLKEMKRADLWVCTSEEERRLSDSEHFFAALDLYLCTLEFNAPQTRSWAELIVWGATLTINFQDIARDLALSRFYGAMEAVPPMGIRRPASVIEVSKASGLPLETVRRHLKSATLSGLICRVGSGYIVPADFLADPHVVRNAERILSYMRRVLNDLATGKYRVLRLKLVYPTSTCAVTVTAPIAPYHAG